MGSSIDRSSKEIANNTLIKYLENLLEIAKNGDLAFFVCVGGQTNGQVFDNVSLPANNIPFVSGILEHVQYQLMKNLDIQKSQGINKYVI
jgi:hypothetical protein